MGYKMKIKMPIKGSQSLDNPSGIIVTYEGAMRFAKQNMDSGLKRAGFVASVCKGFYGDYWCINYTMQVNNGKS